MRILAVSGSLREGSFNTSLLRAAVEAAPEGIELELWEGLGELPLYDEDLESTCPDSVRRLREEWAAADAILFSTPEYNGSVPGGLKNAIDWASRPARGRAPEQDRSRSSAQAPASSARSGRSRTSSESSASPAPASSGPRSRSAAQRSGSTPKAGSSTEKYSNSSGCT